MAYCTNCGATISDNSKFCENCGAPVAASAEPARNADLYTDDTASGYNANTYAQTAPVAQPTGKSSKGLCVAGLVFGILSAIGVFFFWHPILDIFVLIFSILAIALGAAGMKRAKQNGESAGMGIAGLVCGILGLVFSAVGLVCWGLCIGTIASTGAYNNLDLHDLLDNLNSLGRLLF